jgi:hypothetical protein
VDTNVVELRRRAKREEPKGMRKSLLAVGDDRDVRQRVAFLAERVVDILSEIAISEADRQSLPRHLSLIH